MIPSGVYICQLVSLWYIWAKFKIELSSKKLPIICRPIGLLSIKPFGSDRAGNPARFAEIVNKSSKYTRSDHLVGGIEFNSSPSSRFTFEAFYKIYDKNINYYSEYLIHEYLLENSEPFNFNKTNLEEEYILYENTINDIKIILKKYIDYITLEFETNNLINNNNFLCYNII